MSLPGSSQIPQIFYWRKCHQRARLLLSAPPRVEMLHLAMGETWWGGQPLLFHSGVISTHISLDGLHHTPSFPLIAPNLTCSSSVPHPAQSSLLARELPPLHLFQYQMEFYMSSPDQLVTQSFPCQKAPFKPHSSKAFSLLFYAISLHHSKNTLQKDNLAFLHNFLL